ncbi:MAG: hypothetical protein AB7F43_06185 [Bacteriovoracia bacterium]
MSFKNISTEELKVKILVVRKAIRYHRDQKMDDRCWLDDYLVWNALSESEGLREPPSWQQMQKKCETFFAQRRSEVADEMPPEAKFDPQSWDKDLDEMKYDDLQSELKKIDSAIEVHKSLSEKKRTLNDDRELYRVLPEKIACDFRLPDREDFLGERKAPDGGCPSFWRSHQSCNTKKHNLHIWGPCKKQT